MAPGVLVFSNLETSSSSSKDPTPVDLSLVVNFTVPRSEEKINTRLILELSDEVIKIKFRSVQDLDEWCEAFKLWKEYAIDYGNIQQGDENLQLGATLDDLKIEMEDGDEEQGIQGIDGTFCHRSPFNKSKSKSTDHDDIFNAQNTRNTGYVPPLISTGPSKQIHDEKPTGITEGWLEKKKSSKMFSMGPEWQKRYFRIDQKTRCLMYGKTPSMSHDSSAATSVDLTMISDILNEDADGRSDSLRITLVGAGGSSSLNDDASEDGTDKTSPIATKQGAKVKIVQLRAVNGEEGEKWVKSLNEWRDYFLLQYSGSQGI